jgi:succinoglycan biosynthesis transport protein ExoP
MDFPEYKGRNEDNESLIRDMNPGRTDSDTVYEAAIAPPASLFEYGRLLMRRKGVLLIAAVLGMSMGLLVSMPRTRLYQARTTLEIQGVNENILNTREINPAVPSSNITALEEIQTQIKILQSESLIGRVINKFGLSDSFTPLSRLARWRAALGFSQMPEGSQRDAAVMMAAQTIRIESVPQARVISIFSDSTDPKIAAEFLNTLSSEFMDQKLEKRLETNERTSDWLNKQVEGLKLNIEKSEERLQSYALSAGLMFTSEEDSSVAEQKLKQLQAEVSTTQADRVAKQAKFEIAKSAPPASLPQVLDDVSLRNLQARLAEMRGELAQLNVSLTPEHYRVQRLQAQIDELEAEFERARGNIIKRIANEYDDAKRREELLLSAYSDQTSLVTDQAAKVSHYGILKREVESSRALYEAMMQRVKEYSIASAITANNVRVVDAAVPPPAPYKPDIYMYTMLGMVTGVFFAMLLIIRQERVDRTIHAPGEAPGYLKLPELGVILSARADMSLGGHGLARGIRALSEASKSGKRAEGDSPAVSNAPAKRSGRKVELITWENRSSLFSECFRTTAASLLFTELDGKAPHVLVVTSCSPQDGKSTTASNLAVALAETKRRVLVIDADLRRPHMHSIFQLENNWGLIDILQSNIDIHEYPLDMLAQETSVPNVYVLTSATHTESIVHLLHSARLPELLRRLRREFDVVIIDAPPVACIADARVLARLADGVVFVVRSTKTTRDMALAACRQFREDGSRVIGTILNMWDPRDSSQRGTYTAYHDTYYQYYTQNQK